ncbi:MAG: GNAT family N-acetyltransferase, partial [Ginsengibacter sp.]
ASDAYNTYMINMYDKGKLIAAGFFDIGQKSTAGICSIYDPAYRKYSLGKYMIYEKMFYSKREGFDYFYPGYVVPGYSMFDYKLDIGSTALEYLNRSNGEWIKMVTGN